MEQEAERLAQLEHVDQRRGADEYDQADEWGGRGTGKRTCECECELSEETTRSASAFISAGGEADEPCRARNGRGCRRLASAIVFKCDGGVRYIASVRLNHWAGGVLVRSSTSASTTVLLWSARQEALLCHSFDRLMQVLRRGCRPSLATLPCRESSADHSGNRIDPRWLIRRGFDDRIAKAGPGTSAHLSEHRGSEQGRQTEIM